MTAMAARFLVVAVVAALVAGGLVAAPKRAAARPSSEDAAVVEVCRYLPFTRNPYHPEAFGTGFLVRVTNVGGTVSDGALRANINHSVQVRQKRDPVPVTASPVQAEETVLYKWQDGLLFPGVEMTIVAEFDARINPSETWKNNMTFADPWAVPAC